MLIEETENTLVDTVTGERWMMTTNEVLLLSKKYPAEQLWLPFVKAMFAVYMEPPKKQVPKKRKAPNVDRKITLSGEAQMIYIPVEGVHQMVLPFSEAQIPSAKMFQTLRQRDFPAFQRDMHEQVYATQYIHSLGEGNNANHDLKKWIKNNCRGRVGIKGAVVFEESEDYLLAILSGLFSDSREQYQKTRQRHSYY